MASAEFNFDRGHLVAKLTHFGMDEFAAAELTQSLHERPTRAEVLLWIREAEIRMYRRFIPLWLPHLGALVAILWKVFGN